MHEIQSHTAPPADFSSVKCIQGYTRIRADYSAYLSDESKLSAQPFDLLFFPKTEAELAAVIRELARQHIPMTIAGARTGLVGGSVPAGGAVIALDALDQVESIAYDVPAAEYRVVAQAAVSLKALASMLQFKRFPGLEQAEEDWTRAEYARFKADPDDFFYPPDPTEMSASLGGSVATNASGARTYRYGPTRSWVRGLRVFLASGEYLDIPRGKYFASPAGQFRVSDSTGKATSFNIPSYSQPRTKNTAGIFSAPQMDLVDLFIGSEGVFGVITRVEVALLKREEKLSVVQFLDSDEQAMRLTQALRSAPKLTLDFLEFYSENALNLIRQRQAREPALVGMPALPDEGHAALFFEMSFDPSTPDLDLSLLERELSSCGAALQRSWVGYEPRELERFKVFRHLIPETVNEVIAERKKSVPGLHKLGTDLAVPDEHLADMWALYRDGCNASGLDWLAFGHIGNNHIHVNILPRSMADQEKALALYATFARQAVDYGGAVSAEHGIGKLKSAFFQLMYTPAQIEEMKAIKRALDPAWLLNRGDIFEEQG